jgi:hypothetical protein
LLQRSGIYSVTIGGNVMNPNKLTIVINGTNGT